LSTTLVSGLSIVNKVHLDIHISGGMALNNSNERQSFNRNTGDHNTVFSMYITVINADNYVLNC